MGVEDHELRTIERNYRGDNERCKYEMLICCSRSGKLPTWKGIVEALQLMGEHTVASKIRARHCSSSTAAGMCLFCLRAENLSAFGSYNIMKQQHNLVAVHYRCLDID